MLKWAFVTNRQARFIVKCIINKSVNHFCPQLRAEVWSNYSALCQPLLQQSLGKRPQDLAYWLLAIVCDALHASDMLPSSKIKYLAYGTGIHGKLSFTSMGTDKSSCPVQWSIVVQRCPWIPSVLPARGAHVRADSAWGWRGEPHVCSTFLQVKCNFGCGSRAFEALSSSGSVLLQE